MIGVLIKILIIGKGSIGLYLEKVLSNKINNIIFFDSRNSNRSQLVKNSKDASIKTVEKSKKSEIGIDNDIIFVCTKSYDVNRDLLQTLSLCRTEVVFLQNGVSLYLDYKNESKYFHFGTILGIQAELSNGNLQVSTQNCTIAVKEAKIVGSLHRLRDQLVDSELQIVSQREFNDIIIEKFIRWLTVSTIMTRHRVPLGVSLEKVQPDELLDGIVELTKFTELVFQTSIDPKNVIEKINSLPRNMTTSSYRDYYRGKKNELMIEINRVIDLLLSHGVYPSTLIKWHMELKNE